MKKLYGIVCANVTPMNSDASIDLISLARLVDHMATSKIHSVYPCGTNGEGILLSPAEHHAVADKVIQQNAGRMSAFVQCANVSWSETMNNIRYTCSRGADGVGVMTPIFYKADDTAMIEYYHEAALAAEDKPVYIYNIAKYTNNDVSAQTFSQIIEANANIKGIKYSSKEIERIEDYMRLPSRKPEVLIGADSLILSALAIGCTGEVSGPACVFPRWYVGAYESFMNRDLKAASFYQNQIIKSSRSIKSIPQIPAIKAMLKMQGIISDDTCRRPFRKLTSDEYKRLEIAVSMYEKGEQP